MQNCILANLFTQLGKIFSTQKYMKYVWLGLWNTLYISLCAAAIGLFIGTIVAIIKIQPKTKAWVVPKIICEAYTTVIRGTPMALQLFIMAFAVFAIRGFPLAITAIIAFGINSGAYVSENIRAGILSVDKGQTEASRALGVSSARTMLRIVIPQGMKNVIPSVGNELIALIKETSIVSMVGTVYDLTYVSKLIGAPNELATYLAPMLVSAAFYLLIVYALTLVIKLIERRLRKSEKR